MVGESPAMTRILRRISRLANVPEPVLLSGEYGTGKRRVARELHRRSYRSDGPFVEVSCESLDPQWMQCWGTPNAQPDAESPFVQARGGTLLLDELVAMDESAQLQLLRLLEDPGFREVRLLTATTTPPLRAVQEGTLRPDLYYRLEVFHLDLPPLRDRLSDIEPLTRQFLSEFECATGRHKEVDDGLWQALRAYSWPGNVRELKATLSQAFLQEGDVISPDLLPSFLSDR